MEWLNKIISYFKGDAGGKPPVSSPAQVSPREPIIKGNPKSEVPGEIPLLKDITDEQIERNQTRSKYITETKNPDYVVCNGDNPALIAKKFGVEPRALLALNGLTNATAKKIRPGQKLKIPPTRTVKNVKTLNDIAKAMGVSVDFIKKLKAVEDSAHLSENEFHNTVYTDKAGVETIGIGHVVQKGEKRQLTDAEVCELCARDLVKREDNLRVLLGKDKFDNLPRPLKEALLDMTFNKGTEIIEKTPGLLYCLKEGKYEAAINLFTYNKSTSTDKEMSGLSKRRLFDMSLAFKMYNGEVQQTNINTAQKVYNRGIELLKEEYPNKKDFAAMLAGYNNDVEAYFGKGVITLTTK